MSEEQYKELENKWDNTQDLNTKLEIIKQLFNADNLSDYTELDNDAMKELTNNFIGLQTIENIKVFDNFFTNTKFNNKYDTLINNLKHFIYYNISNDVISKIKNTDDKQIINSYISAFASSHISYYLRNILINLDIDKRIKVIDDNNITDKYLIENVISQSNSQEKLILLEKFINKLDSYHIKNILETISDIDIKKELIIKYINLFDRFDQVKLISSFKNFNDIKDIIEATDLVDKFINSNLLDLHNDNIIINLIETYFERFKNYNLYTLIISISDNKIVFDLFKKCANKLGPLNSYGIFEILYNRFNEIDEINMKQEFEELSNILDNITDNYLSIFYTSDVSEILSLYDYEGKVKLIDKYIGKIKFNWDEIIAHNEVFDDSIKLYKRYSMYISDSNYRKIIKNLKDLEQKITFINLKIDILISAQLKDIILDLSNVDDIKRMINIYHNKLTEDDIVEIICKKYPDSDKLEFIKNDISRRNISLIISSMKDEIIKLKYIDDNDFDGSNIAITLASLLNDDLKINYLYKYENKFSNSDLTDIISSIKNFEKKLELIEKYSNKLDMSSIATKCSPKESIFLMKKYSFVFSPFELSVHLIINFMPFESDEFIKEFFDLLPQDSIINYLIDQTLSVHIKNNLRNELTNKYFKYFDKFAIGGIFNLLDRENKKNILKLHEKEMDSTKITIALSTFDDINDILELLNEYKNKINNEDIIYIILGNIRNSINKGIAIENDKLLYIYSLIFNGKIDENKCKNVINNLVNLDIYSLTSIENYLLNNEFNDYDNFDSFISIISKLSKSNSTEIQHLTPNLVNLLMGKEKSSQDIIINELEQVFLKNNLPMMAKIYKVFDIMHPNFGEFNGYSYQSPNLNARNNPLYKQIILFADLMKITVGSNNRSLKEYVKHIEVGNNIAKELITNNIDINFLDDNYKEILINYLEHLKTLYNNTLYGKNNPIKLSGNIEKDILMFISLFGKNESDFDINKLPDRIVKMFAHFAGIDTMEELKTLMDTTIRNADQRNRYRAKLGSFEIHKGYYVKGIANQDKEDEFYSFLTNIFQNGSLCKELLGDAARSDTTPMDTDVSRMLEEPASFEDAFSNPKYASSRYGPLWIVLKDDDRFNEINESNKKYIPGKLEVFETSMDKEGHYGIRTGFASSDIDYLVVDESRIKMDRIKYEIVMNGFYIPLVNTKGNLVFTPLEYDELHEKMAGLSYYNTENEYRFAEELDNFDIDNTGYNIDIENSINEVAKVREEVINRLRKTGLNIKLGRSLDLSDKCIDLIDTGSTSRGTNKMDGYDFDFVMRVDKEVYTNDEKMNKLYQSLKNIFPDININGHKIRKYKLKLDNGQEVEIDITFIMKTNKMDYSTEECLQDRLKTIKNMNEEKYKKVLENIVLAKYVLKSVYKSKNVADNPQGGLGGVGIENWILQNGGSFERAVRDFLDKANGRNFQEFCKIYTIWDFGQNNLSFKREDGYTHDEFITNNMSEEGYNKMVSVLKEYINTLEHSRQL